VELHLLGALLCPEHFKNLHGKVLQAINSGSDRAFETITFCVTIEILFFLESRTSYDSCFQTL
jgi:hypothetical protein